MTNENKKIEEDKKEEINTPKATEIDASKATEIALHYLERVYGNLNMSLFRIEEVRQNDDKTKYYVICSLITSLGSPKRTYYFLKVDIGTNGLILIYKGFRNESNGKIEWTKENLPPEER